MIARVRELLAAVTLGAAGLLAGSSAAVAQPLPAAPVPVLPPVTASPTPAPTLGAPYPIAAPTPGPPQPTPYLAPPPPPPPPSGELFPGAGGGGVCPPADSGFFFDVELEFLKPHLSQNLTGTVTFPGGTRTTFRTPQTGLDWTVAPRFEVGYNFGDDFGSLSAAYRFLVSDGQATENIGGGQANVRTRLSLDQFDFDYTSGRFSPGPFWDLKWRVGTRLADVYFDDTADDGFFQVHGSSNFIGAGPHFGLDAERRIGLVPGLALFGRADGAVLVGELQQRFHAGADGTDFAGNSTTRRTQTVPMLDLQAGLSYTPPRMDFLHFTAGYMFEQWWNLGRSGASRGDLTDQGVFLRGEFDY